MKILFLSLAFVFFGVVGKAADDQQQQQQQNRKSEAPPDYYDGTAFDGQSNEQGRPMRNPSGELPYSDDEIKQNSPETYKNMPVDQD